MSFCKMNAAIISSFLLWFCTIYHVILQGGEAAGYTNGFPSRLIDRMFFRAGPSTRLIPDMNFTCNGVIVGYTATLIEQNGDQDPVIQVWRENTSQPGSYYKTSAGIAIDKALCVGGLTRVLSGTRVFHCNLNQSTITGVAVQPGDILGLELPPGGSNDDILLAFARISRGPISYVFTPERLSMYSGALFKRNWEIRELPQITLEIRSVIGSGSTCISGFPDFPVSRVYGRTTTNSMTTLLIPEMNFTCNESIIVGFILAGRNLSEGPHSKIQIWRSQNSSVYYQTGHSIPMQVSTPSGGVCMAAPRLVGDIFWCILHDEFRVSVQSGDILGLELPHTKFGDEIFFADGARGPWPVNYVFKHQDQLGSNVKLNLSNSSSYNSISHQLPQLIFNLASDFCLSGFPDSVVFKGSSKRGELDRATTRLFPDLKFGCFGTIVKVTAAVMYVVGGQIPKIQIWRKNETQPGHFNKLSSNDLINPPCYHTSLSRGIYKCILTEDHHIPVQPGDFLGLEIPPINNDNPKIYFKAGGPTNLVFQDKLNSTVNLSSGFHTITNDEPQITFLVILDENGGSCPSKNNSVPIAATTTQASNQNANLTGDNPSSTSSPIFGATSAITGSIIGGIIAILLLVAIVLLMMVLIQQRKKNKHTINSSSGTVAYQNPVYDGASYNRLLPTKGQMTRYKGDAQTNYDHIKFNVKKEAVSLYTDDQNSNAAYESLETQHYEMTGPTLATHEEPYIYWEPAKTVNDLHKQMSSNKYRELLRRQVKITKALGSGQFGVVSMGVWQSPTGAMEVAVKQLQPGVTETEKIRFLQEAAINGQFRHPNVVQLMGVVTTGEPAMIVLELLSNGDLRNFLIKHQSPPKLESGGVDKHLLLQFCQHIASGMSYLSSKAFVHRDLAARNILVSKDKICKISDFGMSRDLLDEDYYVSHGGMIPVKWTAPEAIHYKKYSTASDVWSFGCVMYEIWSLGHKPFENYNNPEVIKMIDKGCRLPPPPGLSKELYKIMIQCWQPERSRRPTFPQLVELLSRADFELFLWEEEDLRYSDPRVKEIGAPLEITTGLYPELQKMYLGKQ